jgi:murein DD-endopeptidase MepM/ murein hydrolase activator NlpD
MQRRLAVLALALALVAPGTARALDIDSLLGTWYVLSHYKDSASDHPDRERWVDRVWKFERKGDRIEWTDYPIVVFEDETGRFERLGTNRQSRILHYWEPSEGQLADIADGLEVNKRGAKTKTLKPTGGGDWSSGGRAAPQSMNMISYVETWSITGLAEDRPVFERADSLSSGMTETLDGVTRYSVETLGAELRGRYERDGTQEGTFRMIPSVGTSWVKGSGKTQNQRFREMAMSQYSGSGDSELREAVREVLEASLAESGISLPSETLDGVSKQILDLYAQGKSPEEVQKAVENDLLTAAIAAEYSWAPTDAVPDPGARYALPFASPAPRQLVQGNNGQYSHFGPQRYAFDWRMPVGDTVVAARGGKVAYVVDEYDKGGPMKSLLGKANVVAVLHDDGTFAVYAHLSKGVDVEEGDEVEVGDPIGKSGNTGYTSHPHLHFGVFVMEKPGEWRTVPIRFAGKTAEGFVPAEGLYYGGPDWKAER